MMENFNVDHRVHLVGLYTGTMAQDLADIAPARFVPAMKTPDGTIVAESLAIAETLAEAHPDAGMWPNDPAARATARWLCAEMATSFGALRGTCPMQLQHVNVGYQPCEAVIADLVRLESLWTHAAQFKDNGPWLFGGYSIADAFFAPVCARIIGYDLPINEAGRTYCMTTITDPAFKTWRNEGLKVTYDPFPYNMGVPVANWPT